MNVLVACEYSGIVRDEFSRAGWDAWSCDLLPTESKLTRQEGKHYQCDIFEVLFQDWDMLIAFPPCTYLTVTANKYFLNNPERWEKRLTAVKFVYKLINADIKHIAIENPVGVISTHIRKPDQYIQPYHFGHHDSKKTGLWLKNLPLLIPSDIVKPDYVTINSKRYSKTHAYNWCNGKLRSKTYHGIAKAMATQWTEYINNINNNS